MSKKSVTTNLLEFLKKVTRNVDNGDPMDVIYLDFSKAFDKVSKLCLIEKIKAHSIVGKALNWIMNWLIDRHHCTVLNGFFSDWSAVESGVLQGSVLGPLASVVFINDLDDCANLKAVINKFADDAKLGHLVNSETDQDQLQYCLNKLLEWAETWCMEFNVNKCKVINAHWKEKQAV